MARLVDQLDLKQAIASLQIMNAKLSSELSTSQSAIATQSATMLQQIQAVKAESLSASLSTSLRVNATVQQLQTAQEATRTALNQYFPNRYFAGPQLVISAAADAAHSVYAADLDNDGDMDVLSASLNDDTIAWYRNDGSGFSSQLVISTAADGAHSVYAADLDNDGDMDVLSASVNDDKIAWYRNDGNGSFSSQLVISIAAAYAR
jgi:hypothetical protein